MELDWIQPSLIIVTVGGRSLRVGGEVMEGHDPDFLIYPDGIRTWSDGTPVSEAEKEQVLGDLVAEAARRGWVFEIFRR